MMYGKKIYYGLRWIGWNVGFFTLAVLWLHYQSVLSGNALRFLMAFSFVAQLITIVGYSLVSDADRQKATSHLVFSRSFFKGCNFIADLALALLLATYGQFFWSGVAAVSLILTGASIDKGYDFREGLKKEVETPKPECGCQHCN